MPRLFTPSVKFQIRDKNYPVDWNKSRDKYWIKWKLTQKNLYNNLYFANSLHVYYSKILNFFQRHKNWRQTISRIFPINRIKSHHSCLRKECAYRCFVCHSLHCFSPSKRFYQLFDSCPNSSLTAWLLNSSSNLCLSPHEKGTLQLFEVISVLWEWWLQHAL